MSAHVDHQLSQHSSSGQSSPTPSRKMQRCSYSTSDNRRCKMFRHASHPALCLFHARKERLLLESERVGPELTSISGEFRTTTDINHALGKLWDMLAHDRIPRKRAATMAYIAALLLPTVSRLRLETSEAVSFDAWKETLQRAFPSRPALPTRLTEKK